MNGTTELPDGYEFLTVFENVLNLRKSSLPLKSFDVEKSEAPLFSKRLSYLKVVSCLLVV